MIKNKNILIGVTGSIAAYKAAFLIRLLIKEGANVKVVMTDLAKEFISPLTLATLSKNPVLVNFFNPENGNWNSHVDLGTWANAYVIAPATANTIAKMAHGIADNLLLTTYLSARCPVFIAPAMDLDMFRHKTTTTNISILSERGNIIIEPSTGNLASGLEGKGRMEDPEKIIQTLNQYFKSSGNEKKKPVNKIAGKKILITAGPTHEPLDPVRFIGNYSTGKMGYALAEVFAEAGADVTLISGSVNIPVPKPVSKIILVKSSDDMYKKCLEYFPTCNIAILAAAVADYTPARFQDKKIKSDESKLILELQKTVDIAEQLGKLKKKRQFLIGFALETDNELENAQKKMQKKNFDLIVLNSLRDQGAGFSYDTNKVSVIGKDNKIHNFGLKSKTDVALDILHLVQEYLK
ncbi:MAG: bifunctional phosphopantothenoylcysteine decarboxylase/phosphopantothenate--cysteine ligase CoaBC [Bacteroidales bacterium]|nr:bifunctional phosphopantothenoylcysteine decarboxylase/phosphopantothenate--cysteine ligase CoaBC [Bacteroidales bacterium]